MKVIVYIAVVALLIASAEAIVGSRGLRKRLSSRANAHARASAYPIAEPPVATDDTNAKTAFGTKLIVSDTPIATPGEDGSDVTPTTSECAAFKATVEGWFVADSKASGVVFALLKAANSGAKTITIRCGKYPVTLRGGSKDEVDGNVGQAIPVTPSGFAFASGTTPADCKGIDTPTKSMACRIAMAAGNIAATALEGNALDSTVVFHYDVGKQKINGKMMKAGFLQWGSKPGFPVCGRRSQGLEPMKFTLYHELIHAIRWGLGHFNALQHSDADKWPVSHSNFQHLLDVEETLFAKSLCTRPDTGVTKVEREKISTFDDNTKKAAGAKNFILNAFKDDWEEFNTVLGVGVTLSYTHSSTAKTLICNENVIRASLGGFGRCEY